MCSQFVNFIANAEPFGAYILLIFILLCGVKRFRRQFSQFLVYILLTNLVILRFPLKCAIVRWAVEVCNYCCHVVKTSRKKKILVTTLAKLYTKFCKISVSTYEFIHLFFWWLRWLCKKVPNSYHTNIIFCVHTIKFCPWLEFFDVTIENVRMIRV